MATQWEIISPPATHYREARCWEVDCPQYLRGWQTILPRTDIQNIAYIKSLRLRYREEKNDPLLVTFFFEPGQECFAGRLGQHKLSLSRPPLFTVSRHYGQRTRLEWERWINDMDRDLRALKNEREG